MNLLRRQFLHLSPPAMKSAARFDPQETLGAHQLAQCTTALGYRLYCALTLAARITLPHFSVSSAMS
jgi:hypothetical protein